ncbi:recombinase family protein [Gordonia sp. (in: high G+C Gram-positive bacteria)]|uniref:recombinase family protein n=1 Tax=Gordonia sp. (in: high G+C Gram-positive bacteria) TaxID=84139 RepID=UPI003342382D
MTTRAAIYTRISLDAAGHSLGVKRQEEDARAIIAARGWDVAGVWSDNSVTASDSNVRRPGYDSLLNAYDAGLFDALVCWDLDRLTRQPRQLEDWIDRAESRGLAIVTSNGEADLTTDGGRMYARIKAAVARAEIERKSARQKRAEIQRAHSGMWRRKGPRPTGYTQGGDILPGEADVVRRIFREFIAGETVTGIARRLDRDGVPTRGAKAWHPASVRSILVNPLYAARVSLNGEVLDGVEAQWEPLIDGGDFDRASAIINAPERRARSVPVARRYQGSGLYICGECGYRVASRSSRSYQCKGHVSRLRTVIDEYVNEVIAARLRRPDAADLLADAAPDVAPLIAESTRIRGRIAAVDEEYMADEIDGRLHRAKVERLRAQLAEVEERIGGTKSTAALSATLADPDPGQAFLDSGLMMRRSIIDALAEVRLFKNVKGKHFEPDTVQIWWRGSSLDGAPSPRSRRRRNADWRPAQSP